MSGRGAGSGPVPSAAGQSLLMRVTLDNVDQGIAYFDDALTLSLWNDRFFELHGFPDEMKRIGLTAEELLRTSCRWGLFGRKVDETMVPAILEDIRSSDRAEMHIHTREGRLLHSVRTRIDQGSGFIISVRDLTGERAAARARDEFVSTVSHELRTPLTAVRGALALLGRSLGDELDERAAQMLGMAQKNAARLGRLIDDILDIERLTRGDTTFVMVPIDLRQMIADAIEQNEPFATALEVTLEGNAPSAGLRGDPGRLLQVLTNLISNAVRHSPAGSRVVISGEAGPGNVRVSVRDTGCGVPPDFVPQLFQRFAQAGGTARRGNGGTGLGLAISRAIVAQHGGTTGYDPVASGGSCFWISLPV